MHHYIISPLLFFGESGLQNNHKITVTALLSCIAQRTEFSQWLEWLLLRSFNGNEQAKARQHQETQHEQKQNLLPDTCRRGAVLPMNALHFLPLTSGMALRTLCDSNFQV